jgi:hypothetical protein
LERALHTSRSSSRHIGLVNDYLWDENEELDWGGPLMLPVSPLIEDESGDPLWFTNSRALTQFRGDAPGFTDSRQRVADRTTWALQRGGEAIAVIEIDEDRSLDNLPLLLERLAEVGVDTCVLGNEIDDPFAFSFRFKPERLVQAFGIAHETLERMRPGAANLCLPASPYLDDDGTDVLQIVGLLPGIWFNGAAHHYFGPVGNFIPWVDSRRATLSGIGLRHYLTELGNPVPDLYHEVPRPREIAEGFIPQILALAVGSHFFEHIYYHSLLNTERMGHSLARVQAGALVPEDGYRAFVNMVKLLDPARKSSIRQDTDYIEVAGERTDRIRFSVLWSMRGDKEVTVRIPEGSRIFDAFGQQLSPRRDIVLQPQAAPYLGGPARITLY